MAFERKWQNKSGTKTYYAWRSMRHRCLNKNNKAYHNYGGRGITVCDEWADYDVFFKDMGECPEGLTLERIDVNSGYHPDNCRWATAKDQGNNKRHNRIIHHQGKSLTLTQWADHYGIGVDTLHHRLERMPVERAMTSDNLNPRWDHGTRTGYELHKCRCDLCKSAHNARMRECRSRRKQQRNLTEPSQHD